MASEYMTEQEQIEQLKNWLKQYGPTVIIGILLSFALMFAWHSWQQHQEKISFKASTTYDEMLSSSVQNNIQDVSTKANQLISQYAKTPYAQMAALILAKNAIATNNYSEAIKQLQWVATHSRTKQVAAIAELRLARVFLSQKNYDDALSAVSKVEDKAFLGLAYEVKGDIYQSMKQNAQAKESYNNALKTLPEDESTRKPLIQMKIDNL